MARKARAIRASAVPRFLSEARMSGYEQPTRFARSATDTVTRGSVGDMRTIGERPSDMAPSQGM